MKTNHVHVHKKSQDSRGTPCSENLQHCQSSLWHDHFHLSGCFQANPDTPISKNQYHWMGHVDHIQIILGQSTVSLGLYKGGTYSSLLYWDTTFWFGVSILANQRPDSRWNFERGQVPFQITKITSCIDSLVNCLPRVTGPVYLLPNAPRIITVETSTFTNFRYRSMSGKAAGWKMGST